MINICRIYRSSPGPTSIRGRIHQVNLLPGVNNNNLSVLNLRIYTLQNHIINYVWLFFRYFGGKQISQSSRFKNFDSSRNSLNLTLRPNSDDSLCHGIDSCKIFGSTEGVRPNEKKTDRCWF